MRQLDLAARLTVQGARAVLFTLVSLAAFRWS
jgi:hypothetical protein